MRDAVAALGGHREREDMPLVAYDNFNDGVNGEAQGPVGVPLALDDASGRGDDVGVKRPQPLLGIAGSQLRMHVLKSNTFGHEMRPHRQWGEDLGFTGNGLDFTFFYALHFTVYGLRARA